MSDSYLDDNDELPTAEQIEAMVRGARHYLRPSEDLRPRTLEAARQYCDDRRSEQKLGGLLIAAVLLLFVSSPALRFVDVLRNRSIAPTAADIQARAVEYSAQPEIGTHWGLAEAYSQMRRIQANRLGQTYRSIR